MKTSDTQGTRLQTELWLVALARAGGAEGMALLRVLRRAELRRARAVRR